MRMIEAVRAAIGEEMERDDRVLVMGEDVGQKTLYARVGHERHRLPYAIYAFRAPARYTGLSENGVRPTGLSG